MRAVQNFIPLWKSRWRSTASSDDAWRPQLWWRHHSEQPSQLRRPAAPTTKTSFWSPAASRGRRTAWTASCCATSRGVGGGAPGASRGHRWREGVRRRPRSPRRPWRRRRPTEGAKGGLRYQLRPSLISSGDKAFQTETSHFSVLLGTSNAVYQ